MKRCLFLILGLVLFVGLSPVCGGEEPLWIGKSMSVGYGAYSDARDIFDKHALDQSHSHEVVSVRISYVTAFDLRIFGYVQPLSHIGMSVDILGDYDEAMEMIWINMLFSSDGKLIENDDRSLILTGVGTDGRRTITRMEYYPDQDQLRLEVHEGDELLCLFEYVKTEEGYAAQYYFESVTSFDFGVAKKEMCVYRTYFSDLDGSCARFDGVGEPESIMGLVPTEEEFIMGATHWFTLAGGSFSGNLGGQAF